MSRPFRLLLLPLLAAASGRTFSNLEADPQLRPVSAAVGIRHAQYAARAALEANDLHAPGACCLVPLSIQDFHNGTIEAMVAGRPQQGARDGARGFIGIAFRVQSPERYEAFYIRPTNGRAPDQLRRNHATQYISEPEYPWQRLRSETPGLYESYADMEPGVWAHLRIEVEGDHARLFVNHAPQPVLIVNDLKHGAGSRGGVALWIGSETQGYFSAVSVRRGD